MDPGWMHALVLSEMLTDAVSQVLCPRESYRSVEVEKEKLEVESVVNQRDRELNESVVVGVSSSHTRTH